jgi:hypothetical protein
MDGSTFFLESQRSGAMWLMALAGGLTLLLGGLFGFGLHQQLWRGIPFGSRPMSDAGLVMVSLLTFGTIGVFDYFAFCGKMMTEVRADGVHVTSPFLKRPVFFSGRSIRTATARDYDAVGEFDGWGVRHGASGPAYTAHGNHGVDLTLADGRHVLIGSQDPVALAEAIDKIRGAGP